MPFYILRPTTCELHKQPWKSVSGYRQRTDGPGAYGSSCLLPRLLRRLLRLFLDLRSLNIISADMTA